MPTSVCTPGRARPSTFGAALAAAAWIIVSAAAAVAQPLNAEIRGILDRARLGSARVGISVIDADTGTVLARLRSGTPAEGTFTPASNMKLLTSGAALLVLGPEFEFRTQVYRSGTRLVIQGGGDPGLADPALLERMREPVGEFVDRIVRSIADGAGAGRPGERAGGYTEVIVDDRIFDREYVRETWPQDQLLNWYCAEVSGLNFHANVLRLYAAPADQDGMAPRLRWEPTAPGIDVLNRARTARRAESTTIGFAREPGPPESNTIVVKGALKAALVSPETVTLRGGGLVLARMVAERLRDAGLSATGGAPACRLAADNEAIGAPDRVLVVVRTPMRTVLERCNHDSHNLYAECLLKRMGHAATGQPGSWANGAAVIRMQVRDRLGPDAAAAIQIIDGSGLSRGNAVTPEVLTAWLAALARDPKVADAFIESLAVAGQDGTMARRFRGRKLVNEVRGKSGLIDGVRTLSGYVTERDIGRAGDAPAAGGGRRLAYSILVNDIPASVPGAKVREFHEDVVAAVDRWLAGQLRLKAEAIGG